MSLQVRLRHALDEQVLDLEPRTLKRPILVGRSAEADLQVPTLSVASKHCVLFVHNGRWMVQALASGGATWINETQLSGAVALRTGDQITVGAATDAAVIEIDPAGSLAGKTGTPIQEITAETPAGQFAHVQVASPPSTGWPATATAPSTALPSAPPRVSLPMPPARVQSGSRQAAQSFGEVSAADPDAVDWGVGASTSTMRSRRRPAPKPSNLPLIIIMILVAGVTAFTITLVVKYFRTPEPAPVVIVPPVDDEKVRHHGNIFTSPERTTPRVAAADPGTDAASTSPSDGVPRSGDLPEPQVAGVVSTEALRSQTQETDADWEQVLDAADLPEQGVTILKIDDYSRKHPGLHTNDLKALEADALDQLWWKRLTQLFNRKHRLEKQLAGKASEIRDETDPQFKQALTAEQIPIQAQLDHVVHEVLADDMGYTASTPPDVSTKYGLADARQARNQSAFSSWSKSVSRYIRSHNGQAPWGGEE